MDLFIINIIDGLIYGLLLFMLSSGLTLIFSMMGVLNLSHAAFYMLGAYLAYQISVFTGFWVGLIVAPILVTILGAAVERYGLRRVHQYGHVPELIFTFGLFFVIEELVQYIWGPWPARGAPVKYLLGEQPPEIGANILLILCRKRTPEMTRTWPTAQH